MDFLGDLTYLLSEKLHNAIKSGDNYRSACPVCESQKSRPFVLFDGGNHYCHSCETKGTAQQLITDIFKLDINNYKEALKNYKPEHIDYAEKTKDVDFIAEHANYAIQLEHNKARALELFYELISEEATHSIDLKKLSKYIGYDKQNDTLTVSIFDGEKVVNIKKRFAYGVKWFGMKGGDGKYAPHRITDKENVYIASGMAEFLLLHGTDLDYIVMQSDGQNINNVLPIGKRAIVIEDFDIKDVAKEPNNKHICDFDSTKCMPFKQKVTDKVAGDKIGLDFSVMLDIVLDSGYDLRDFVNEFPGIWLRQIKEETKVLCRILKSMKKVEVVDNTPKEEIVIEYDGDYAPYKSLDRGVVHGLTGSGKTFCYENAGNLILVPLNSQANIIKGDSTDFLIQNIFENGAIITYDKFGGHYYNRHCDRFRKMIDSKTIKIVVDEAHTLLQSITSQNRFLRSLDAVFLSGTVEKFFRRDLQHYYYVPKKPREFFYTGSEQLPLHNNVFCLLNRAIPIIHNYKGAGYVGVENCLKYKYQNVDLQTVKKPLILATWSAGVGNSIKNPNFTANFVHKAKNKHMTLKDTIQALSRVRGNEVLRVMSGEPNKQYNGFIDFDWWRDILGDKINNRKAEFNAVAGEFYDDFVKKASQLNKYKEVDDYGIECCLAHLTRNNYDDRYYSFTKIDINDFGGALEINLETDGFETIKEEGIVNFNCERYKEKWSADVKNRRAFRKWCILYESGRVMNMVNNLQEFKNLKSLYRGSKIGRGLREDYNKKYKKAGKKYDITRFLSDLKEIICIEIRCDITLKKVEKVRNKLHSEISIKCVGKCPIESADFEPFSMNMSG